MNNRIWICLVTFILGAGAGFLVAKKVLEEKYAKIAQEEIDSVKETYEVMREKVLHPSKKGKTLEDTIQREAADRATKVMNNLGATLSRSSLDGTRTNQYDQVKRNYNIVGSGQMPIDHVEPEGAPDDEDEDEEPLTDAAGMTEQDHLDITKVNRTEPYVIEEAEYSTGFDHHDKLSLYYYRWDDVLCEENEEVIDDIDGVVGFAAITVLDTQDMVWVRNERLAADYEIIGLKKSFAETVHGIIDEQPHEKKRRESYDE